MKRFSDIKKLSKKELNKACKEHGVRLELSKSAKVNILCAQLGISTSGPSGDQKHVTRAQCPNLSAEQFAEYQDLTIKKMEAVEGWTKEITQVH